MQKITPFLWFDSDAEEAVNLYTSVFKDSKILMTNRYGEAGPGPKGSVMTISFELFGQCFTALNAGPHGLKIVLLSIYHDPILAQLQASGGLAWASSCSTTKDSASSARYL